MIHVEYILDAAISDNIKNYCDRLKPMRKGHIFARMNFIRYFRNHRHIMRITTNTLIGKYEKR